MTGGPEYRRAQFKDKLEVSNGTHRKTEVVGSRASKAIMCRECFSIGKVSNFLRCVG